MTYFLLCSVERFGAASREKVNLEESLSSLALNPLDRLQNLHRRNTNIDNMDSKDIEVLLMKKRREERLKKQQEEQKALAAMADYDLFNSSVDINFNSKSSQSGPEESANVSMAALMKQQMQMNMQLMRKNMLQSKMFEEEMRKREEKRKFDELQSAINSIQQMIMIKGANPIAMGNVFTNNNPKGSVKARVGPKNPIDVRDPSSPRNNHFKRKTESHNDRDRRCKRYKFDDDEKKLPGDLVLTNLTDDGPKPAPTKITWSDEDEDEDSYNWKRSKKLRQVEDE